MRKKRNPQFSPDLPYRDHVIYDELCSVSQWLDAHPQFIDWVFNDLSNKATHDTGRDALTAESVLRIAFLRQRLQCSFEYLSFTLTDSRFIEPSADLTPDRCLTNHLCSPLSVRLLQQLISASRGHS